MAIILSSERRVFCGVKDLNLGFLPLTRLLISGP